MADAKAHNEKSSMTVRHIMREAGVSASLDRLTQLNINRPILPWHPRPKYRGGSVAYRLDPSRKLIELA
jgi:hypothetical protein